MKTLNVKTHNPLHSFDIMRSPSPRLYQLKHVSFEANKRASSSKVSARRLQSNSDTQQRARWNDGRMEVFSSPSDRKSLERQPGVRHMTIGDLQKRKPLVVYDKHKQGKQKQSAKLQTQMTKLQKTIVSKYHHIQRKSKHHL